MDPRGPSNILIVVPTYDEAPNVVPLTRAVLAAAPGAHLLFVDDNSRDGTRAEVRKMMAERPGQVNLIERERKLGLGTAYVAAFNWGLARSYDAFVEMDADFSHRAEDLPKLLDALRADPVVIGSRYVSGGGTENWGWGRRLISRAGSLYARTVLRMSVRDLTGGFNAWRREVLEAIEPDTIRSEGYTFQIELKFRAHLAGFPLREVPILFVERRAGQSKMSGAIVLEAIWRVWGLAARRQALLKRQGARNAILSF